MPSPASSKPARHRRRRWPAVLAALAAALALALLGRLGASAAGPAQPTAQVDQPQFNAGPCPFPAGTIPAGEKVDCGDLIVPENRDQPDSPTVSLAVAILRTHNPNPQPDPIVFLADGPGQSGLGWLNYFLTSAPALRADRDIILLDQRGTGYSQPSLACTEFDSLDRAAQARQLSLSEANALAGQTAAACHDRLVASGVDLTAFNTRESAADVKDLRVALGYLNWNLYGVGYGARLALAVLRDYPDGVRSVVLDSPPPPQVGWWETSAANANRAFNALFNSCAQQPACNAAFPNLAITFSEAVGRLNATPLSALVPDPVSGAATPELLTGDRLVASTVQVLGDERLGLTPYLPLIVGQLDAGNIGIADSLALALAPVPDLTHSGVWYSVQCHDEAPFNAPAKILADANSFPLFRDLVLGDSTLSVCPNWGAGQAASAERQPVHSGVPALVLAGNFDPFDPPAWSQLAASTLSQSYYYLLPGAGHGASLLGCGQALAVQFIEYPALAPKPVCDTGSDAPAYVTSAYVNPSVERVAQALVLHFDTSAALPFLACAGVFATALLVWPPAALLRRPPSRQAGFARWLATVTVLLDLFFAVALVVLIWATGQQQPQLLLFGLPSEAAPLFWLPWLAALLTAGVLFMTLLAWKDEYWSLAARVHFTLVAGAAAGFIWLLYSYGVLRLS